MLSMFQPRLDNSAREADSFLDPIKRSSWKGFRDADRKMKVITKGKSADIAAQRDILGFPVASSSKEQSLVDIDKAKVDIGP